MIYIKRAIFILIVLPLIICLFTVALITLPISFVIDYIVTGNTDRALVIQFVSNLCDFIKYKLLKL